MYKKYLFKNVRFAKTNNKDAATRFLSVIVLTFCTFLFSQAQRTTTQKNTQTKPAVETPRTAGGREKDSSAQQYTPVVKPLETKDTTSGTTEQHNGHLIQNVDALWEKTITVPYIPLKASPVFVMDEPHTYTSKDLLFFIVCGLFLLYGIIHTAFPKYTYDLFLNLVSFSSLNKGEANMRENNLPSLLLNILFCLSSGLLVVLMIGQVKNLDFPFWQIWLLGSMVLGVVYLVKFLTIYLSGRVFDARSNADTYMYVVFMVNKVIGILCLPTILIYAFIEDPQLNRYIVIIGGIVLGALLLYRYIMTFLIIVRNMQLNAFHFFLYLCGAEIIPMLVLYELFF